MASVSVAWEGGGSRGIANGGVYAALEATGILHRVKCAGGASIGALFALFVALRAPSKYVIDKIFEINLRDFIGSKRPGKIDSSIRYLTKWGIFSPDPLFIFVRKLIAEYMTAVTGKESDGSETLSQIAALHGCHLLTTVTNVSTGECVELNDVDHPVLPAYWAVALSMVIPLVFVPVQWNNQYWVDGGIANGLPFSGVKRLSAPRSPILIFAFDNDNDEDSELSTTSTSPTDHVTSITVPHTTPSHSTYFTTSIIPETMTHPDWNNTTAPSNHLSGMHYSSHYGSNTSSAASFISTSMREDTQHSSNRTQHHRHQPTKARARSDPNNQLDNRSTSVDSIVDYIANLFQTLNKSRGLATFMREFDCVIPNVLLISTPGVTTLTMYVDPAHKQFLIDRSYAKTLKFLKQTP